MKIKKKSDKRLLKKGGLSTKQLTKLIDTNTLARIQIKILEKGIEEIDKIIKNMKKVAECKAILTSKKGDKEIARAILESEVTGGDEEEEEV